MDLSMPELQKAASIASAIGTLVILKIHLSWWYLTRTVKALVPFLAGPLDYLFNKTSVTESTLSDWRTTTATTIYKKGSKHDWTNCWLVSFTSSACKIMERILNFFCFGVAYIMTVNTKSCQNRYLLTNLLFMQEDDSSLIDIQQDIDMNI